MVSLLAKIPHSLRGPEEANSRLQLARGLQVAAAFAGDHWDTLGGVDVLLEVEDYASAFIEEILAFFY